MIFGSCWPWCYHYAKYYTNLFVGEKKRIGGYDRNAQYISLLSYEKKKRKILSVPLDNACTTAAAAPWARTHGHTNKNAVQKSPVAAGRYQVWQKPQPTRDFFPYVFLFLIFKYFFFLSILSICKQEYITGFIFWIFLKKTIFRT